MEREGGIRKKQKKRQTSRSCQARGTALLEVASAILSLEIERKDRLTAPYSARGIAGLGNMA